MQCFSPYYLNTLSLRPDLILELLWECNKTVDADTLLPAHVEQPHLHAAVPLVLKQDLTPIISITIYILYKEKTRYPEAKPDVRQHRSAAKFHTSGG